ncbi:hypothetical protein Q4544_13405 [Cognatishimia sp. 1_MG-2023]|uniref:hypothetical protein n=1 Tax=Cognatishimia sp. 1_MG-2023 TaxID=3062642 RepID=UPI0026E2C489|nr:hypothetical protein [Cognatishimia sp. 1_MG-2023]MDO6727932.1 hypothetical protein [Cognatishimia sp. 1_MG-2023]
MNRVAFAIVLSLTGPVSGTALFAASSAEEAAPEAPVVATPKPEQILAPRTGVRQLFDLDLRRWPEERFYENLTAHIDALSQSHGIESVSVLMDTAELYLGQMMVYEAGSVLDSIEAVGPDQERRLSALLHARSLLEGAAVEDFDNSPLAEPGRADRAFWAALQAIASADAQMLTVNLELGLLGLMHQTRPVARTILPVLTEAMIETGEHQMAAQALRLMEDFPDISESSTGAYLRGRAQEVQGNESSALAAYFTASKGWDRYAARSRLALAKMALEDGGRGAILAAKDVLEFGADSWKGDYLEVATLQALAKVYQANRDSIEALKIHGRVMLRFPGSEAAAAAEAQASVDLEAVYNSGASGEIALSQWLSTHYRLVPAFRYYEQFPEFVERMGDFLLKEGGTTLATQEYQRALDLRRDLSIHYPGKRDEEREFLLRYKLAQAFEAGGQLMAAKDVLMSLSVPEEQMKRDKVNLLRADILAQLGDHDGLLRTHVKMPTANNLRNVARALWDKQDWSEAVIFFDRLWSEHPGNFNVDDATYLLIAAHRSGDTETAERVVDAFPGLTESEGWQRVAESILATPAEVFPLTRGAADKRMNSLQRSLENLSNSGL